VHDQSYLSFILQIKPRSVQSQDRLSAKNIPLACCLKGVQISAVAAVTMAATSQKRNQWAKSDGCLLLGTSAVC
jgi:hypothetical protein